MSETSKTKGKAKGGKGQGPPEGGMKCGRQGTRRERGNDELQLTPGEPPDVSLPPGDGPRHFHFHPNGRWLYSIQEEGSTIVMFDFDAAKGRLASRQTISTLPPGCRH
jgi:hypothetical protein